MLTSEYAPVKQFGNGVNLNFDFNFKILAATDLVVFKIDASNNQSAALILGTDYTVTFDPIAENGQVTYTVAPVNGGFSLITRVSDNQQESSLQREGPFPAKTVETMTDKLTALIQELQVEVALLIPANYSWIQVGAFTALDATATIAPFLGVCTDSRTIQIFTGNRTIGTNGWVPLGSY